MDEELRKRLRAEITKSGIPLELSVVAAMRGMERALVRQNVRFERDSGVGEIDVVASLVGEKGETGHPDDICIIDVVVECKRSREKPWVFFEEAWDPLSAMGLVESVTHYTDVDFVDGWSLLAGCHNTSLASHHYNSSLPSSRSYFEAFQKDAGQDIYRAIQSVEWGKLHIADSALAANQWKRSVDERPWRTRFIQGVIVFDGVLALAVPTEDGFDVEPVDHLLLRSDNLVTAGMLGAPFQRIGGTSQREVVIDVVHVSALQNYLAILQQDFQALVDHLRAVRGGDKVAEAFR